MTPEQILAYRRSIPQPEAEETELERWVRKTQLDDCPFCPQNWKHLTMSALPIHIGPYGMPEAMT